MVILVVVNTLIIIIINVAYTAHVWESDSQSKVLIVYRNTINKDNRHVDKNKIMICGDYISNTSRLNNLL